MLFVIAVLLFVGALYGFYAKSRSVSALAAIGSVLFLLVALHVHVHL